MMHELPNILRRRIVLVAAAANALFPLTAFSAWTCTDLTGKTYSSSSSSACQQYYPKCMSTGDEPSYCISPNFQLVSSSSSSNATSTQTSSSPHTSTSSHGSTSSSTHTSSPTHPSTSTYTSSFTPTSTTTQTSSSTTPVLTSTQTATSTATETEPEIAAQEEAPAPVEPIRSASLDSLQAKAAAENQVAFAEAVKLQTMMAERQQRHAEAVEYYKAPGKKDPLMAAKFFSYADSPEYGLKEKWDTSSTRNGDASDVSKNKNLLAGDKDKAIDRAGKSGNEKIGAVADTDIKALLKASGNEKIAQLVKDASLREKLENFLAENEGSQDPEILALAAALAAADSDVSASPVATTLDKKPVETVVAAPKTREKDGSLNLNDEENQMAVGRLLASMGGESAVSEAPAGEGLFVRVHSAHKRSLERGDVVRKLRRK